MDNPLITRTEDSSFVFGVTYCYIVNSLDEAGESDCSHSAAICLRAPAPTDLIASYTEHNGKIVSLQWVPVVNSKGYIVKRATDSLNGPFSIIKKINDPSVKQIEDTTVIFGTTYYYTITSIDEVGESNQAHSVGVVCRWAPVPIDLTASYTENAGNFISLQWKSVANGKGYIVRRTESSAKGTGTIIKILNDSSIKNTEDPSFVHSIHYHYTIASIVEGGESNQSSPVGIYIRVPPPINVVASFESHNNNFVLVQWDPVLKSNGYVVKRATDSPNGPFLPIGKLDDPLITKFEDNSVLFGSIYVYSIFSRDRAGESDCSSDVTIICSRSPSPKNVRTMIPKDTGGTIILNWSLVPNCSGYKIYRMIIDLLSSTSRLASENSTESINFPVYEHQNTVNDGYSEFLLATITDPTVNAYMDSSAQNGIYYDYMIASVDAAGVSFCSKPASGKAMLPFPTNVCAKVLHDQNAIALRWTGIPVATGYRIKRKDNLGHSITIGQIFNTSITEFTDKQNVLYNTTYIYTIYAIYDTTESIPSSPVKVKLLSPKDQTECLDTVEVRLVNLVTEKASNELTDEIRNSLYRLMSLLYARRLMDSWKVF